MCAEYYSYPTVYLNVMVVDDDDEKFDIATPSMTTQRVPTPRAKSPLLGDLVATCHPCRVQSVASIWGLPFDPSNSNVIRLPLLPCSFCRVPCCPMLQTADTRPTSKVDSSFRIAPRFLWGFAERRWFLSRPFRGAQVWKSSVLISST